MWSTHMKRSDIIVAIAGALALVGYLGLIAMGEVRLEPTYVEVLLMVTFGALGYDTITDYLEDINAEETAETAQELLEEFER